MRNRFELQGSSHGTNRKRKVDPRLPPQVTAQVVRTHDLLDEDDWTT
jgi:hypothetical protein